MKLAVRRTSTAIAALATVGVSSLFAGVAPASAAADDACGATGALIATGICEATFASGTTTFTPPAPTSTLEVLLVGAGGAGSGQLVSPNNGYAAGGGGGEVKIVDFTGTTDEMSVVAPTPGQLGSVTAGAVVTTVANGLAAVGGVGGTSGSGKVGASEPTPTTFPYGGGGGASASPVGQANGGAGVTASSLPSTLFTNDITCYGGGGAVGIATTSTQGIPGCGASGPADATNATLTAAAANRGGGGGALETGETAAAASGVVVIRWSATATLSFSENGHGTAPAAQTVAAGAVATRPADPTAAGVAFQGWYTDPQLTTLADFSAPVSASTTYYASWAATLAATGIDINPAQVPSGIAALVAGIGLVILASRRRRSAN